MPGLSLETRHAQCAALKQRVLDEPRLPDGRLAVLLTPADTRFFTALALDFYNGASGRCDPGLRAIGRKGRMVTSTAGLAAHRLKRAGWLTWKRKLHYVHGRLRWGRQYILAAEPPMLRPRSGPKPIDLSKRLRSNRTVDISEVPRKPWPHKDVTLTAAQWATVRAQEARASREATTRGWPPARPLR